MHKLLTRNKKKIRKVETKTEAEGLEDRLFSENVCQAPVDSINQCICYFSEIFSEL